MTTEASPKDCSSFDKCSAPLCPLYGDLAHAVWYPGEEVCRSTLHRTPWIRVQRRIARRCKDTIGYFNVKMLESVKAVHPSIRGINPDEYGTPENWVKGRIGITP